MSAPDLLHNIPERPLVVLEPRRSWAVFGLHDVWAYRELLYFLTWRDIKVRYKQTLLGAAWAIIQPLFTMLIFTLFFGRFAGMPSDGLPYSLFAFAGLLPWTFFSNAVTNGGNSLIMNANLISKTYFPRVLVPASAVAASLVDLAISMAFLAVLMAYYGLPPRASLMLLPVLVLLVFLLAFGVSLGMSALNVRYRDVRYTLPFVVQLLMFATPIIYPASIVPERWRWVLALNPLAAVIEAFRAALFGLPIPWGALAVSALTTLALLLLCAIAFHRMERSFADLL